MRQDPSATPARAIWPVRSARRPATRRWRGCGAVRRTAPRPARSSRTPADGLRHQSIAATIVHEPQWYPRSALARTTRRPTILRQAWSCGLRHRGAEPLDCFGHLARHRAAAETHDLRDLRIGEVAEPVQQEHGTRVLGQISDGTFEQHPRLLTGELFVGTQVILDDFLILDGHVQCGAMRGTPAIV